MTDVAIPHATASTLSTRTSKARRRVLVALAERGGELRDRRGSATSTLAKAMGVTYTDISALSGLLKKMADDGLIVRDYKPEAKKTYGISLVDPCPHPGYQAAIDEAKARGNAQVEEVPSVLDKLDAAQSRIDAAQGEGDETPTTYRVDASPQGTPYRFPASSAPAVPEPAAAPEPEPDAIDYDALAARLLNRVLEVSSQDVTYVRAELDQARERLSRARQDLAAAREDGIRFKRNAQALADELAAVKDQLVAARRGIRERDENIAKLTQDHRAAVKTALSDAARRELERTMVEAPRPGAGG